ncbi:signal peptidase I [Lactococcus termiticola]|uniref:Signal peptidase I n=1 Tax=Lactococcus termiticola TaxID=2169526 RepID=A0A2R5HHG0_9LACT|nr:signal peptidase I [Lactococcus termiticola]GBG97479.1 signal peptidase I [Lactococcus termiticola]
MEQTSTAKKKYGFTDFLKEWTIPVLIIVLFILSRIFVWTLVLVDGHSMDPTLADRERMVLIKTATPQRFDIVVAKESDKDIVKRVIGMPGDTVNFNHDKLTINGKEYKEPYLDDFKKQLASGELEKTYASYPITNALPESQRSFFVGLAQQARAFTVDSTGNPVFSVKVPEGQYFLMGDNRIVSSDSRAVGSFERSNILGVVKARIWPLNKISLIN